MGFGPPYLEYGEDDPLFQRMKILINLQMLNADNF